MATFYGSDSYCLTDVQLIDLQVTDPAQLIGQRIARRLQTPYGALAAIGDDPDFGFDVRQLVNGKIRPADLGQVQALIRAEVLKDEQIESATVNVVGANGEITISIAAVIAAGPFSLTMNVNALTTDVVFGSIS